MSKSPIIAKSTSFPFQIAIACWIDLLGYGQMIADAKFNPLHPKARRAITRIRRFHQIVAEHSARYYPTLVMNDGAVAYRDLSMRSRSVTHDFLKRSWLLFEAINAEEQKSGHPGARQVLSCGFRMRGRRAGLDASRTRFESIIARFQDGAIDAKQAVHEAAAMRPQFDVIPQLQANFAFTKAYVAESSGTSGGLPGPNFYLDLIVFEHARPEWIQLGPNIDWACPKLNLKAKFAAVQAIPKRAYPAGGPREILDGHRIAQLLANDAEVLAALRKASEKGA